MKLRHLHINHFGHFDDCDLAIPNGGLQLVYGPNEAGKTTLLEFLRGLLFDFPERTPYGFGAPDKIAGVGTMEMLDGRQIELRRRKGRKNTVAIKINGRDTDLDANGFLGLIGRADRHLFEMVFAFGIEQLSRGEESLKHEHLQSALFGGGLGGTLSAQAILSQLDKEAAELFSPSARKPAINALSSELAQLSTEVKQKSLRSDKYRSAEQAVQEAATRAKELHERVNTLRLRLTKVERLVQAADLWWKRLQLQEERQQMAVPAELPSNSRQLWQAIDQPSRQLDADIDEQSRLRQQAEQDTEALTPTLNPLLLARRAEIKQIIELKQSVIDARRDLPEREQQREQSRSQIDRELAELRPGWSHADLMAFTIDATMRHELERLTKAHQELSEAKTKLLAAEESASSGRDAADAELAEGGTPRDLTELTGLLSHEAEHVSGQKEQRKLETTIARLERQLETRRAALSPPLLPTDDSVVATLPVPHAETIQRFDEEFARVRDALRAATASVNEDENELRGLREKLTSPASVHPVPSLTDLETARRRRDAGWSLIRTEHLERKGRSSAKDKDVPSTDTADWLSQLASAREADGRGASARGGPPVNLIEGYEESVRIADDIANQIYENADAVAERDLLERQAALAEQRIREEQAVLDKRRVDEATLQTRWSDLWAPCGFKPLEPDAMQTWLKDHEAFVATWTEHAEACAEAERLNVRVASYSDRLTAAVASLDEAAAANGAAQNQAASRDVASLLARARDLVAESKEQLQNQTKAKRDRAHAQRQLAKIDGELTSLSEREAAWKSEWQAVLTRLNLPVDWSPDLARSVIERLIATRVRLDGLPQLDRSIELMNSRINEFEQHVRSLCEVVAPQWKDELSELAAERLLEGYEKATNAAAQLEKLQLKASEGARQLAVLESRRSRMIADRDALFTKAQTTDAATFLNAVERMERRGELDQAIERLSRDIEQIRQRDDRDQFEQTLATTEPITLQTEARELQEQLATAESQRAEANNAEGAARAELRHFDGSGEAAILSQELADKRSHLAEDVQRYVPLVVARHLFAEAVRRFERDNQPEMLATVSDLMRRMTSGRYVEFDRTGGDRPTILLRRSDGAERTPDQLSTGTREQLYLAIRLAYVLHYCRQNEPLPIVMDDVLVNFDDDRSRHTLAALADVAQQVQILFFTCHSHTVELARQVIPDIKPIEIPGTEREASSGGTLFFESRSDLAT